MQWAVLGCAVLAGLASGAEEDTPQQDPDVAAKVHRTTDLHWREKVGMMLSQYDNHTASRFSAASFSDVRFLRLHHPNWKCECL